MTKPTGMESLLALQNACERQVMKRRRKAVPMHGQKSTRVQRGGVVSSADHAAAGTPGQGRKWDDGAAGADTDRAAAKGLRLIVARRSLLELAELSAEQLQKSWRSTAMI